MDLNKKEPRIYIFTGHYGSGKTEIAVNFAAHLKKLSPEREVAICDLDIVNPFFRTADAEGPLKDLGIRVEIPLYAKTNVDIPALTPQMLYLIEEKNIDLVLDIGGDDVGAKAVGRYAESILKRPYELFFVLNKNRPFTKDLPSAMKIYNEISYSCGIPFTGIVNNTHMLEYSDTGVLASGLGLCQSFTQETGLPLAFHSIFKKYVEDEEKLARDFREPVLLMEEYISLFWSRGAF